jgi:hypothetical protein
MKNKIYIHLSGGLGNQMFQYAAAKSLSIKKNYTLIVDTGSGYLKDPIDNFKLIRTKLTNVLFKKFDITFIIFRLFKKILKLNKLFNNFFWFTVVDETVLNNFSKKIKYFNQKKDIYLLGYFQSEKYFSDHKEIIIKELSPPKPKLKNFLHMQKKIKNSNSISIGIRFYELLSKNLVSNMGGVVSKDFYIKSVKAMLKKISNPKFFIFSTKKSNIEIIIEEIPELKKFDLNFITADEGYEDAYSNIWLMSYCKHHIISNSTLYWWAVYFSELRYKNQKIICSNNFINRDTRPVRWS